MLNSEETAALFLEIENRHQQRVRTSVLASDQVLEDYAAKPLLNVAEAVAIIQGFTPPVGEDSDKRIYYLDDNAEAVQRLLSDGRRGKPPLPCRPRELMEWSETAGVDLPSAFVRVARAEPMRTAATVVPPDVPPALQPAIRSGGRLDSQDYDPQLQAEAHELAIVLQK